MTMQTGLRSCRRQGVGLLRMAISVVPVSIALSLAGCAEIELSAETYKKLNRPNQPATASAPAQPAVSAPARNGSIDPTLQPDPRAFHATGFALWDGTPTLSGIWIAHPMADIARRVRLTNGENGIQTDAAMFRRDPKLSGPRILVSSDAARILGLEAGHATGITIEGLSRRVFAETASSATQQPGLASTEVPPGGAAAEPAAPTVAAAPPAPPTAPDTAPPNPATAEPAAPEITREPARPDSPPPASDENISQSTPGAPARASTQPPVNTAAQQQAAGTGDPAPEPAPEASGNIADGRYFIQAGVFGEPGNATRLVAKLRAADLPAKKMPLILGERRFTRVLIGPYRTNAERNTALEIVRKLGPADATPVRG